MNGNIENSATIIAEKADNLRQMGDSVVQELETSIQNIDSVKNQLQAFKTE
jgi:hypothetical protein